MNGWIGETKGSLSVTMRLISRLRPKAEAWCLIALNRRTENLKMKHHWQRRGGRDETSWVMTWDKTVDMTGWDDDQSMMFNCIEPTNRNSSRWNITGREENWDETSLMKGKRQKWPRLINRIAPRDPSPAVITRHSMGHHLSIHNYSTESWLRHETKRIEYHFLYEMHVVPLNWRDEQKTSGWNLTDIFDKIIIEIKRIEPRWRLSGSMSKNGRTSKWSTSFRTVVTEAFERETPLKLADQIPRLCILQRGVLDGGSISRCWKEHSQQELMIPGNGQWLAGCEVESCPECLIFGKTLDNRGWDKKDFSTADVG